MDGRCGVRRPRRAIGSGKRRLSGPPGCGRQDNVLGFNWRDGGGRWCALENGRRAARSFGCPFYGMIFCRFYRNDEEPISRVEMAQSAVAGRQFILVCVRAADISAARSRNIESGSIWNSGSICSARRYLWIDVRAGDGRHFTAKAGIRNVNRVGASRGAIDAFG